MKRVARLLPAGWSEPAEPPMPEGVDCAVEPFNAQLSAGLALTPLSLAVKDLTFVDAGLRAAQAGYDAILIDTVCDYGLPELRSCLGLPVYGAGESAVRAGLDTGEPCALVTVWAPASRPLFDRVLARSGATAGFLDVWHVFDEDGIAGLGGAEAVAGGIKQRRDVVIDAILATCRAAIDAGAGAVVLGCTCMSPASGEIAQALGVPVIDPLAAGIAAAVAAARGNPPAVPASAQRASTLAEQLQVRQMIDTLAAAGGVESEDCPVCVL